jgi:hypothetical protein
MRYMFMLNKKGEEPTETLVRYMEWFEETRGPNSGSSASHLVNTRTKLFVKLRKLTLPTLRILHLIGTYVTSVFMEQQWETISFPPGIAPWTGQESDYDDWCSDYD